MEREWKMCEVGVRGVITSLMSILTMFFMFAYLKRSKGN